MINPQQPLTDFKLDERLAGDTIFIRDLKLSSLLLMNDARYPWLILVPRRAALTELYELSLEDSTELLSEIDIYSRLLKERFSAKKINVANLGNIVSQLHVHIVARLENDEAWPGPVWGRGTLRKYTEVQLQETLLKVN